MIRRILDSIRRWWRSGGQGQHSRPRYVGGDEFTDLTGAIIPRKPTIGRPPWETAPMPTVCLFPQTAAPALLTPAPGPELPPPNAITDPPRLHPLVRAQLGADSVAELIESLFPNIPLPAAA